MQRKTTCIRWLYLHSAGTKYAQPFLDKLQWCKSSKTPALIRDFSYFLPSSGQVWLLLSSVWEAGKQVGGAIISQGSGERLVLLDLVVLMFMSIEQGYHKVINPGISSQTVLSHVLYLRKQASAHQIFRLWYCRGIWAMLIDHWIICMTKVLQTCVLMGAWRVKAGRWNSHTESSFCTSCQPALLFNYYMWMLGRFHSGKDKVPLSKVTRSGQIFSEVVK